MVEKYFSAAQKHLDACAEESTDHNVLNTMTFFENGPRATRTAEIRYELLAITPRHSTLLLNPIHDASTWLDSPIGEIGKRSERHSRMPGNPVILYDWYSAAEDWTTSIKQLKLIRKTRALFWRARSQ
jgi:hypothetical protein